jgi:hypothetical protein
MYKARHTEFFMTQCLSRNELKKWVCNMRCGPLAQHKPHSYAFTECNEGCKRLEMTVQIGEKFQDNYIYMERFIDLE